MLVLGLLLLLLLLPGRPLVAQAGMKAVFGVIGSSVLLDPECRSDLSNSEVLWEFTASNKSPVTILDYDQSHRKVEPNEDFKSRLYFNAVDGSLMLNNLKPSDQGIYTINVNVEWIRRIDFKLIEPLSEPLINSTSVKTTIELICHVSAGKVSSVLWSKDDEVITSDQHYQLVQNNSTLIISEVKKSFCGKYICTVANAVSKKNNSYFLFIGGPAHVHHCIVALSIAALIIAVVALIAVAVLLFALIQAWHCINKASLEFVRNMRQYLQFTLKLSSVILLVAYIYWMLAEGYSGITMIMLVLLCLYLLLTVLLTIMACCRKRCKILETKSCRLIPLGEIIVICASVNLLMKVMEQAGKGCDPAANLQRTIILVVVLTVILVISFALHLACK
uniref:HEPACAM family member 2-like isoform X3 n=1 Tax=Pristiophorus japonicus TaxID=55135 RepID=UPI00398F5EAE